MCMSYWTAKYSILKIPLYSSSDVRIDFATFLEIMHQHSQKEKCQQEIMAAFRAHDKQNNRTVPGPELHNILTNFGEKLSTEEGNEFNSFAYISYYSKSHSGFFTWSRLKSLDRLE